MKNNNVRIFLMMILFITFNPNTVIGNWIILE